MRSVRTVQSFGISISMGIAFVPISGQEARCCSTVYSPEVHFCPFLHVSVPHGQNTFFLRCPSAWIYHVVPETILEVLASI